MLVLLACHADSPVLIPGCSIGDQRFFHLLHTHNICFYKEVDKNYTGCNLMTMKLLNCALVIR